MEPIGDQLGMHYPVEPLDSMYPEIYYRLYPMIKQMCEMHDNPSNPELYPYPSRAGVERMADHIYRRVLADHGSDYPEREYVAEQLGRGGLLRPLILILLIRELLRRRGSY
ncbi:MAG: hypothetical protein PWQ99_645 [Clostridia bacterium]|uniref:Uncharacterized protein n=1 Tax=Thermacetogenium phaeum TaxID=85874 RepID=A0A101FH44_9THEO|nr:MAG: Uncharacterized protein XD66_0341 [Thermacetogenium phaeum]MDK2880870.1 hypothetical protein [Clostridia bacterium]MDN5365993.1 hypothetical protein [Thermacetogenium sp.]MDN5375322.1 hypothetical protein [Thermacetogenium sp.]